MVFWHYLLPFIFFTALVVQLVYILGIFTRLLSHYDNEPDTEQKRNRVFRLLWQLGTNLRI